MSAMTMVTSLLFLLVFLLLERPNFLVGCPLICEHCLSKVEYVPHPCSSHSFELCHPALFPFPRTGSTGIDVA